MKKSLEKKICLSGSLLIVAFVLINVILTYFFMAPFSTLFYRDQMSDLGDSLEEMKVMSGQPFEDAIDEFDAMHGVKVTIIDSVGSWNNIELADGRQGWIPSSDLERI